MNRCQDNQSWRVKISEKHKLSCCLVQKFQWLCLWLRLSDLATSGNINHLIIPGGSTPWKFGWGCATRRWKFQIKICDFPRPISKLTQNFKPYFRAESYRILPAQTFENFFNMFKFPTVIKSHLSKEKKLIKNSFFQLLLRPVYNSRTECTYLPYFRTKWSKFIRYFRPILQSGLKSIPFGAAQIYMAYIREYPPPPPPHRATKANVSLFRV